ncbi:MAG: PAS domain S-box protein, partial [Desulfamplus sp.]|nr:PAS domain S-box protein [Desulfamplus sp.]
AVGLTLLVSISLWAYFNIQTQKMKIMENITAGTNRLSATIKLGTHYAMMLNSRDDIDQIINNIAKLKEIENIRIYNKAGQIKFSNRITEKESITNIKAEACDICHHSDPPLIKLELSERTRIFNSSDGHRMLGIIEPICNEPGCSTGDCHVHPEDKKILGALDVVVSLADTDKDIFYIEKQMIILALCVFFITSAIIFVFVLKFVNEPVQKLIEGTRRIAGGDCSVRVEIDQNDEMGQLGDAVNQMGQKIGEKQAELNAQRDEYQRLFELVPCFITVQDRNFKLLKYNQDFALSFNPEQDDFCFHAYKGRNSKCENCPVEKTFADGKSHYSEESGLNKEGMLTYWIVTTSPVRNHQGEIVAAMEMCLDITPRKLLEQKLEKSEKKYYAIFNNIPNPVFVLDMKTLEILNCNESVASVYGYDKYKIIMTCFINLFPEPEREHFEDKIRKSSFINQACQICSNGDTIYVNIRISPSEYGDQKVYLVTTSDITKRLEAEQQLIQAGKMATLGEMASGIAHELNQPLSVIKTASSFMLKKLNRNETIDKDILSTMLKKADSNVDRASKIINHMRQFARKSDMELEKVQVNDVLRNAFEIFSQQLKLREIEVVWNLKEDIPLIKADPSRLEQVFINLLLNARDAIEDAHQYAKKITLTTNCDGKSVVVEVSDTGAGIPKHLLNKIFEPFFTTKEVGKGTGLGLSISYGIIKECGGDIYAESENDKGACFVMEFPVAV